jgi:hypothetical protein
MDISIRDAGHGHIWQLEQREGGFDRGHLPIRGRFNSG